jgi:hypothetical protein
VARIFDLEELAEMGRAERRRRRESSSKLQLRIVRISDLLRAVGPFEAGASSYLTKLEMIALSFVIHRFVSSFSEKIRNRGFHGWRG